ncbi:AlpA family phage regulatory protein [Luminiphilus sp.]|nr:AlpA family phage regulatory protein [Luminiphilus sp.]
MVSKETTRTRLLRINEVTEVIGVSRTTIHRMVTKDLFPKSVPLIPGGIARAWVEAEVESWLDQRVADRDMEAVNE